MVLSTETVELLLEHPDGEGLFFLQFFDVCPFFLHV
jgi:hypothetical protein